MEKRQSKGKIITRKWSKIRICILLLIAMCIFMPVVKAETESEVETETETEYINETMANPDKIEEFVKANGKKYNVEEPKVNKIDELESIDTLLYGRYQFNYTGAGAISESIMLQNAQSNGDTVWPYHMDSQYYSKLSILPGYEWLAEYENKNSYYSNKNLYMDNGNGKNILTVRGNSSAGELVKQNANDKIYKAYLVVSCVAKEDNKGKRRYLLDEFPITLIGPNTKYITTKVQNINISSKDDYRYMGYMDVTEFVKDQGYGWYYCCNIPYAAHDYYNLDQYAAWRLIVIEEGTDIPIRALRLRIGLKHSTGGDESNVTIDLKDMTTKLEGKVGGQFLYCLDGADLKRADDGSSMNELSYKVNGEAKKEVEYPESAPPVLNSAGRRIVYRTNYYKLIDLMTRNNVPINNLIKFGDMFYNTTLYPTYTAHKYTNEENGEKYVIGHSKMGGDTELLDLDKNKSIVIGNNKKNIKFSFVAKEGYTLTIPVLGIAVDLEAPKYNADIETTQTEDSSITISGYTENAIESNEKKTGLYKTESVIEIDPNIITETENAKIKISYKGATIEVPYKSGTEEYVKNTDTGAELKLQISGNKVQVYWGRYVEDKNEGPCYYTTILTDDKLTYEITGLQRKENIREFENEVYVSGGLYTQNVSINIPLNRVAWDISYLEITDYIDLSLRQFISSIERDKVTINTNREPVVNISPLIKGETTADYKHSKSILEVKSKDIITYNIRIYNEGMFNTYADEVSVFLPQGLEFISTATNRANGWKLNGENHIQTNLLMSHKINKFNKQTLDYVELKLDLQVSDNIKPYTLLTNLAEITKVHAVDENGETIRDINDIDSKVNNLIVSEEINKDGYNGQEDDDDFEKVQLMLMDLQGKVWLDKNDTQTQIKNVMVKLNDITQQQIHNAKTDDKGIYTFKDLKVYNEYTIEFEYDGQTYTKSNIKHATTSYAKENEQNRQNINETFHEITKDGARNKNNANSITGITYNTSNGISKVNRNIAPFNKGVEENGKLVVADMSSASYNPTRMLAITKVLKGDTIYNNSIDYALMEREQISLEVYSDLVNVLTTIKGMQQEYTYGNRNIAARIKDDVYNNMRYEHGLYKSDYEYKKGLYNGNDYQNIDELEVYAIYHIKIYNTSNSPTQITELLNYYDQGYESIVSSVYSYKGQSGTVEWVTNSKYAEAVEYENFKKAYTKSLEGITLEPKSELDIVVKYKTGKDNNRNIILGDKKIATEIYSYSSDEGLIDIQSKPGNVENREKDTDIGPILNLSIDDRSRIINGFVWEDAVTAVFYRVKTGDGLYDSSNESKINNIEVELVEKLTKLDGTEDEYVLATMKSGNSKMTYIDNDGNPKDKDVAVNQGEYNFGDILPGEYIIRFTYGNNSVDFKYNGQDYKSTPVRGTNVENASDATDNKARRYEVLNVAKTMTYEIARVFADPSINPTKYVEMAAMFADTDKYHLEIEHDNSKTNSIDFGLVKRPAAGLQITKEIQNVKLTNGDITIVDTANGIMAGLMKIKDTRLVDIYKTFMLMLDDELMQGADLVIDYKIVVKNVGENDNLANYFGNDSAYGDEATRNAFFATSADIVYDYTNTLAFNRENNLDWEQTTEYGILSGKTQDAISRKEMTVTKTQNLGARLLPGQTVEVNMQLASTIGVTRSELVYLNEVEIVQRSNDGSRRDEEAIPGNYVPGDKEPSERDNWDTDLSITNPTGARKTYYVLALVCAIILFAGIIAIKKFVVDEK